MIENKTDLFAHYPEKLKEQFKVYHKENPHIYRRFVELANQMKKLDENIILVKCS